MNLSRPPTPDDNRGSVAIVVALFMGVFLTLMMLVLDSGYLYGEKAIQQNGADAVAQAAAVNLGRSAMDEIARAVAGASGMAIDENHLAVTRGFYDEKGDYAPFSTLGEFCPEGASDYPDEAVNGVLVQASQESDGLTGLGGEQTVRTAALAYLKRYGLMSLDPEGEIQLGHGSHWIGAPIYAKGKIKLPAPGRCNHPWGISHETYTSPTFEAVELQADKGVYQCRFSCASTTAVMDWEACRYIGGETETEVIDLPPCDKDYVDNLQATADEIFTPGDAGNGWITKEMSAYGTPSVIYWIDLAGHDHREKTIFFDAQAEEDNLTFVRIAPYARHDHPTTINATTFITNTDVQLRSNALANHPDTYQTWGGTGDDQLVIITSGSVELHNSGADLMGVAFRCGGYFFLHRTQTPGFGDQQYFRVTADKSIYLYRGDGQPDLPDDGESWGPIGTFTGSCDFTFGPPCPPSIVRWGIID